MEGAIAGGATGAVVGIVGGPFGAGIGALGGGALCAAEGFMEQYLNNQPPSRTRKKPTTSSRRSKRTMRAAMRVARLYADRPEIYRAASWVTLVELSSP